MSAGIYLGPGNVLHNPEPAGTAVFWERNFFDTRSPYSAHPSVPTTTRLRAMNISQSELASALERASEWLLNHLENQTNHNDVAHELVERWRHVFAKPERFRVLPGAVLRNRLVDCWNDVLRASHEFLLP